MPLEENHLIGGPNPLLKNSSIRSPMNQLKQKGNQDNYASMNEVQKVAESSFASLPNKIVLPYKQMQGHGSNQMTQQRRDRSQTHHLPSSSIANKFDSEYKTDRMDNNQSSKDAQNKLQTRVRFDA